MKRLFISLIVIASTMISSVSAEILYFEVEKDILIIRKYQSCDSCDVHFEFIANDKHPNLYNPKFAKIDCLALDSDGNPLARTDAYIRLGEGGFDKLKIDQVDEIVCKYVLK